MVACKVLTFLVGCGGVLLATLFASLFFSVSLAFVWDELMTDLGMGVGLNGLLDGCVDCFSILPVDWLASWIILVFRRKILFTIVSGFMPILALYVRGHTS